MSTTLTIPQFVHEDAQQVISECKAYYENMLQRSFAPADIEMLLINGLAYREMLLRANLNDAARQNLVDFSRGTMLEYLAALVGVSRLPASGAFANLRFSIVSGHTGVTIPVGTRVQSTDGKVVFRTIEEKTVGVGTFQKDVKAVCDPAGKVGNGYLTGTISRILDPVPFVSSCINIEETTGGADDETDDELRERIKLAPGSFSVAGPTNAYKYFARTASSAIVDVAVTSPNPGEVNIYPLLEGGVIPDSGILDAVEAICNDEKVRPLTDTVNALAPTAVTYDITVQIIKKPNGITTEIEAAVSANLEAYKNYRLNHMAVDVVINQIIKECMVDGVYDVNVTQPSADIIVNENEFAQCGTITATVTGTHDE